MKSERIETLRWFISFVNMDLQEIKPEDKARLFVESQEYLFPQKEMEAFDSFFKQRKVYSIEIPTDGSKVELDIKSGIPKEEAPIPKEIFGRMQWAFKQPLTEYWNSLVKLQEVVKKVFWRITEGATLYEISEASPGHKKEMRAVETGGILMVSEETMMVKMEMGHGKEPFRLSYLPLTESPDDYLRIRLYRLLDGLPSHTIWNCPGCKKYFLNASRRKKTFCSPKCMWRVNAKRWREELKENPKKHEAYLKKQRKVMEQRYIEKRKIELGPNVKIKRRKRKSKFSKKSRAAHG